MTKTERIIQSITDADEVEIMEFDFNECFSVLREMESILAAILLAHEFSVVDWQAMKQAKKLLLNHPGLTDKPID